VVACRVVEVDATAPVVPIDLARTLSARVGPVRDPVFLDSPEDGVEVILADQERVVLSRKIDARFGVIERQIRPRWTARKEPAGTGSSSPKSSVKKYADSRLSCAAMRR
jgi:hypothetical protein